MINSVLALGFDNTEINWSDLTPISIEHKKTGSTADFDNSLEANDSLVGLYATSDIVLASGLIGCFLGIDAASLLGKYKAGEDQQWVKDVSALRDLLVLARAIRSDTQEVITKTLGSSAFELFTALEGFAQKNIRTILVGPGAIALGFVAMRSNSKLKDSLFVVNAPTVPAINEAVKFIGCKEIVATKENLHPLAELALAVTTLKASEI